MPFPPRPFPDLLSRQKGRARPARTYGKRAAPEAAPENTVKRQRSSPPPPPTPDADSLPTLVAAKGSIPPVPISEPAKKPTKSSILGYFRPVQGHSSPGPKAPATGTSTPESPASEPCEPTCSADDKITSSPPPYLASCPRVAGKVSRRLRLKPVGFDAASVNGPPADLEAVSAAKPHAASATPVVVQTTLNLSNKPAFDECHVCGVVYNPLHPRDVKFHSKIHSAAIRQKHARKSMPAHNDHEVDGEDDC
ncbi:hypothetical protein BROUX41_002609 [Berkeleyomyces rouxiae]